MNMKKTIRAIILTAAVIIIAGLSSVSAKAADLSVVNSVMLNDINSLRASQGVGSLTTDASLSVIAATRAAEASTTWSHTRPNGSQGVDMIQGNKWKGENLSYVIYPQFGFSAAEQQAAADVMYNNLVESPSHYSNMVFGSFTKIGIATATIETSEGTRITTAYMFSN